MPERGRPTPLEAAVQRAIEAIDADPVRSRQQQNRDQRVIQLILANSRFYKAQVENNPEYSGQLVVIGKGGIIAAVTAPLLPDGRFVDPKTVKQAIDSQITEATRRWGEVQQAAVIYRYVE